MSNGFIKPSFLFDYSRPALYSDYRSVVNVTGTTAVFERALVIGGKVSAYQLYSTALTVNGCSVTGATPQLFLSGTTLPDSSTRPDWAWLTTGATGGPVAFTWGTSNGVAIGIANNDGSNPQLINDTAGMEYPTWFPSATLAAMCTAPKRFATSPCTVWIDSEGTILGATLEGPSLWAGMPSVNQFAPNLIAFAGQPVVEGGTYNQDQNYIWVMNIFDDPVSPVPLEYGCPSGRPSTPSSRAARHGGRPTASGSSSNPTVPRPPVNMRSSCTKSAPRVRPSS
jgi:hypothetical protein